MGTFGLETMIRNINMILEGSRTVEVSTGVSGSKRIRVVDSA